MLDWQNMAIYLTLAFCTVLLLMWTQRSVIQEFAYPRESTMLDIEGIPSLMAVYILCGWLFAFATIFVQIPGATPATTASTFALSGVLFAGALRLHSLSRSLAFASAQTSATLAESALLFLPLGVGSAIMITGVGALNDWLQLVAPINAPSYVDPQPMSALILIASILTAITVEFIWWLYQLTDGYTATAVRVSDEGVSSVMRSESGLEALNFFLAVTKRPKTIDEHSVFAFTTSRANGNPRPHYRKLTRLLADNGLLVPVASGGFRRHPHFFRAQRSRAESATSVLAYLNFLTVQQMETVLSSRTNKSLQDILPSLPGEIREEGYFDWLLDETLNEMEDTLAGKYALLPAYLRLRYWEGLKVADVASRLGYSREHLARSMHQPAVEAFRRLLVNRISSPSQWATRDEFEESGQELPQHRRRKS